MTTFLQAYLVAFLFWLGISLGCLAILMIHHLAGGRWGYVIRRLLEAGTRTLPVMALLFLPVLLGARALFEWTHLDLHNRAYLNLPFFTVRAVICFAAWIALVRLLDRGRALPAISAVGLIVYGLTMTFAAVDWVMSLEPHWFSTIFGVIVMSLQVVGAFAFVIVAVTRLPVLSAAIQARQLQDLGNFLLTFVIFWAYVAFSQFLIIWMGNLPEEITWYTSRLRGGWRWLALGLVVLHFFVPFLLLLSRDLKRRQGPLALVAGGVFVMGMVVCFWLVVPAFGRALHWLDPVVLLAMGAVWLAVFRWQLGRRSLLAERDARIAEVPA